MKEFLKYTLASIVGCAIVSVFSIFIFFSMLMASAMISFNGNKAVDISDANILHITLNGTLNEKYNPSPLDLILGNTEEGSEGFEQLTKAIKSAKENKNIKGIYLDCGVVLTQYAQLEELRKLLQDFKTSGKFIIAYADAYTQGTYFVATIADKIYLNPSGTVDWKGISANPIFYKGLLDKLGIKAQIFRVGTFKSAVEPYMLDKMSPANREMTQSMIDNIWKNVCQTVAAARGVSVDSLRSYANNYYSLKTADTYVKDHLVDSLLYADQLRDELRRYLGEQQVAFTNVSDMASSFKPHKDKNKVVVYTAEGEILDAAPNNMFSNGTYMIGKDVVADLDKLAHDKKVKAVVLRVNSPGGSAYASEQMWRAVQLLKKQKPVIVSMSGMAASGGYYLSCGANYIFADPTTLTGSIGIFGMIPDFDQLAQEKLGLSFDHVSTNTLPDLASPTGHISIEGGAALQKYIEHGYHLFLSRVAAGRHMKVEAVDKIAQGRVWTGEQALKIKLVDRLGSLEDAIAFAAKTAKLQEYEVKYHENSNNFLQSLLQESTDNYLERKITEQFGELAGPMTFLQNIKDQHPIQARLPYILIIK